MGTVKENVFGTQTPIKQTWENVLGTWVKHKAIWENVAGVWTKIWEANFLVFIEGYVINKYDLSGNFESSRTFSRIPFGLAIGPNNTIYICVPTSNSTFQVLVLNENLETIQTSTSFTPTHTTGDWSNWHTHIHVASNGECIVSGECYFRLRLNADGSIKYGSPSTSNRYTGSAFIDALGNSYQGYNNSQDYAYYGKYDPDGVSIYQGLSTIASANADGFIITKIGTVLYITNYDIVKIINTDTGTDSSQFHNSSTGTYGSFNTQPVVNKNEVMYVGSSKGYVRRHNVSLATGSWKKIHSGSLMYALAIDADDMLYGSDNQYSVQKNETVTTYNTIQWSITATQPIYHIACTPGLVGAFPDKF